CKHHPSSSSHTTAECSITKSNSRSPSTITCHACGNLGHYANDPNCPKKKSSVTASSSTSSSTSLSSSSSRQWKTPAPTSGVSTTPSQEEILRRSTRVAALKDQTDLKANSSFARSAEIEEHDDSDSTDVSVLAVHINGQLDRTPP